MSLTAIEQYMLELINRARLNPAAEAERFGLPLNAGLDKGTISTSAKGVLAPNSYLEFAAERHSNWMLSNDIFSHTGKGGSSPGNRMLDAGYEFTGHWSWRENLAWSGTTGTLDLQTAADAHHEGLYRSEGHRANTFATDIKEVGLAQIEGKFKNDGTTYNASMLTLNFAASGTDHFLTGVAFNDKDGDGFYGVGEGFSGLEFVVDENSSNTTSAGGYSVGADPNTRTQVELSTTTEQIAELAVDLSQSNAKLDYVILPSGKEWVYVSQDAELISGIPNAKLLGVANLDLTGSDASNRLIGNSGRNKLVGGEGDDVLKGGEGRDQTWHAKNGVSNADILIGGDGDDKLCGQSGSDTLQGGAGDDFLFGGGGRDTFIFDSGSDIIADFDPYVDRLVIDYSQLGIGPLDVDLLSTLATNTSDGLSFDFGGGNQLTLNDISGLDSLIGSVSFA